MQEIFTVQALPGMPFPDIIQEGDLLASAYALHDDALREMQSSAPVDEVPATPRSGIRLFARRLLNRWT